jgi:hypothetical protein
MHCGAALFLPQQPPLVEQQIAARHLVPEARRQRSFTFLALWTSVIDNTLTAHAVAAPVRNRRRRPATEKRMTMTDVDEQSASEIRARLEEKAAAYAARDVDAVLDFYEHNEDVSIFDPGPLTSTRASRRSRRPSATSSPAPRRWT